MDSERRRYERLPMDCSGIIKVPGRDFQTVDIEDISLNGARLRFRHAPRFEYAPDQEIELYFYYRGSSSFCSLHCRIKRAYEENGHKCYGVEYTDQEKVVKKVIDTLLDNQ